jgi:hypothetical protein
VAPKRRETESQKKKRDKRAEEKRKEYEESGRPLTPLESKMLNPVKYSASGRLGRW